MDHTVMKSCDRIKARPVKFKCSDRVLGIGTVSNFDVQRKRLAKKSRNQ